MSKRGPKPRKVATVPLNQDWSAAGRGLSTPARTAFNHCMDLLRQRGTLEATDVELVVAYSETIEIRDVTYQQLQKDGVVLESDRGNISSHPCVKDHAAACLRLKILAAEMGLTPSSAKASHADNSATQGLDRWSKYLPPGRKTSS